MAEIVFGVEEFELIENGDYEVEVDRIDKKTYVAKDTGIEKMGANICFKIRSDVNQKNGNRKIWQFIFADKTNPTEWADNMVLGRMLQTQKPMSYSASGKPEWKFADFDSCIQYLTGAKMIITIEKEFDDYKGEDRNVVKYLSYKKSLKDNSVEESTLNLTQEEKDNLPF